MNYAENRFNVLDTTLYDSVCRDFRQVGGFSPDTPAYSTNKTDRHDIAEILLKVELSTIKPNQIGFLLIRPKKNMCVYCHMSKKIRVGRWELIFFFFFFYYRQNRK
jgi:hypothetical protein